MKVKFVVDQLPYPPRNGVTIPTWGYIRLLAERHSVSLVVLCEGSVDCLSLPETLMNACDYISIVQRKRRGRLATALDEVFMRRASFANWQYGDAVVVKGELTVPDVVIASPISCVDFVEHTEASTVPLIAAISDAYISVIFDSSVRHFRKGRFLRGLLDRWRYSTLRRLEGKVLQRSSCILVQTEQDRDWTKKLFPIDLWQRVAVLANGVGDEHQLPSRRLPAPEPSLLFITSHFIPHYAETVRWILANVWKKVRKLVPNAKFTLVGRGLHDYDDLSQALEADRSIEYISYIEDLAPIYSRTRVVIAKIDKSYGFINKVAEALALGIPVVADRSAFNGLDNAINAGAGFAADNANEMIARIVELLSNEEAWIAAASAAQNEIGPNLRWEARRGALEDALSMAMNGNHL